MDGARIGHGHAYVALVGRVVVDNDVVHESGGLVVAVNSQHIAVDAVVENAGGNLDDIFGAANIVAQRINLLVGHRDQVVGDEESANGDGHRHKNQWGQHAAQRDAGTLDGQQFVVLSHAAQRHDGRQQGGQWKNQRQQGGAAPSHKLENYAQRQTFTHQFIYVEP